MADRRRTGATPRQVRVMPSGGMTRRLADGTVCPNEDQHTLTPNRYLAWHGWAEKKAKTHRQIRCEGCDRYAIWAPKTKPGGTE